MKIAQYLSPSKQDLLEELDVNLASFVIGVCKDDGETEREAISKKIEISDDDDILPVTVMQKPKARTKCKAKTRASKPTTVTVRTSIMEVHYLLEELQKSLTDNVKNAEVYHPINVAPFAKVKTIQALIDWLDLRFTVDPIIYKFNDELNARSRIKEFITKRTGIRHYITIDENHITQEGTSFTIRLHDISNKKDFKLITDLLYEKYGAKREAMTIEAIELSLDFYGSDSTAIVVNLHKSMQYPINTKLLRVYKAKWTQRDIPTSPHALCEFIKSGYNIGMGDHRSDEFCVRVYFKRTDKGGQPLPFKKHRARIEVTLKKSVFIKGNISPFLSNLPQIIGHGFKKMQFNKLSKRANSIEKDTYFTQVRPFGQEQEKMLSMSRHKRNLPDSIGAYTWLNEVKSSAVKNLKRKF